MCYLCGEKATSREHLPADNLYARVERTYPMLTVPACSVHNNAFSKDDEQFRSIIVPYCSKRSPVAKELLKGKVARADQRNPKIQKQDYDQIEVFNQWSKEGLYIGKRSVHFQFSPKERECMLRVYRRLSLGIHWHTMGRIGHNRDVKLIDIETEAGRKLADACMPALSASPLFIVGHRDVFLFKNIAVGGDQETFITWTCFFKQFMILTMSYPRNMPYPSIP